MTQTKTRVNSQVCIHTAKHNKSRQEIVERIAREKRIPQSQVFYDGAQALQYIIKCTGQYPDAAFYTE